MSRISNWRTWSKPISLTVIATLLGVITPNAVLAWDGIPGGSLSAGRDGIGEMAHVIDATYGSLSDRVRPSGYAATSVNGGYGGMFVRDSAIQAMAMQSAGEIDKARAVLQYIASYGAVRGLERAPRYLPDEEFEVRATVPTEQGNPETPALQYTGTDIALFKINAPNNGAAQSFIAADSALTSVELALLNRGEAAADVTVELRSDYADSSSTLAVANVSVSPSGTQPQWVSFAFDTTERLVIGRTYYLVLQAAAGSSGDVQYWGTDHGATSATRSYNYDSGWSETSARGAFKIFTPRGGQIEGVQHQVDTDGSAFRVSSGNRVAQPFTLRDAELTSVLIHAWADAGETGTARVSIRTARDGDEVAYGEIQGASLPVEQDAQWLSVPLVVNEPALVNRGAQYVLHIESTNSTERIAVDGSSHVVNPPGAMWNFENGSWSQSDKTLAFAVNVTTPPTQQTPSVDPTDIVTRIGGDTSVVQQIAVGAPLSGLDFYLARGVGAEGDLVVVITDDAGWSRTATLNASEISSSGQWYRFEFPTVGVIGDNRYTVEISAPSSASEAINVYGVPVAGDGAALELTQIAGNSLSVLEASMAFKALSLVYSGESMENQTDGHYMYILAWARYIKAFPNDTAFRDETYPTVSSWADYYLTETYWNDEVNPNTGETMNLLFNPLLEHSRNTQHFPAYDLITNVFASQALHELAKVAAAVPGQQEAARDWADWSARIAEGINDNLVVERVVNGQVKEIYRELYAVQDGATPQKSGALSAYDGFTWVNLAPIAADWYATDLDVMANTYEAYLEVGSHLWEKPDGGTWQMLNACSIAGPDPGGTCNDPAEVIGKGLGWEFALVHRLSGEVLDTRLPVLTDFVIAKTPSGLLQESFYPDGRPKDAGNQEQTSWWIWGALQAYPRPAVSGGAPTIAGNAVVGSVLTVEPGLWQPTGVQLSFQWYADGVAIYGATSTTLTIGPKYLGKRLSARVIGSLAGHDHDVRESVPTEPVAEPGPVDPEPPVDPDPPVIPEPSPIMRASVPTIQGKPRVGNTLTVRTDIWHPTGTNLSYQWRAAGQPIRGATNSTLSLTRAQRGKRVSVTVTGTYPGVRPVTMTSTATRAVKKGKLKAKKVKIKGKAVVDKTLRVSTKKWMPGKVKFSYRWFVGGKRIKGATKKKLKVKAAYRGQRIKVKVTGKKPGYKKQTKNSTTKRIRR